MESLQKDPTMQFREFAERKLAETSLSEPGHRCAKMRVRVVPELDDERMALESRLHDAALDAATPAVHEAYLSKPGVVRGMNVFLDDGRDVTRAECMEVELGLDRNGVRQLGHALSSMQRIEHDDALRRSSHRQK